MNSGNIEADTWIAIGRANSTGVVNLSGTARLAKVGVNDSFITIGAAVGTPGGNGTINVSENATFESATGMVLSENAGTVGIVNQTGGTVRLNDFENMNWGNSLDLDGANEGTGEYHLSGGTLAAQTIVGGDTGLFDMTGGVLNATSFEGNLSQNGGTLSPGASPGTMTVTGDYSLDSGDLFIELDGVMAGTGYDQLIVTGDVSLAGDLTLALGFTPGFGDMFTIIDNQGSNPVSGMFSQGTSITEGGFGFGINYAGGDGNDVVLTVVPEPAGLALLAMVTLLGILPGRRQTPPRLAGR